MGSKVSIVIVNFNAGAALGRCLESIRAHAGSVEWDAVVVDNASTDGSETIAESFDPRVTLIRNPRNAGFACAANLGVKHTSAPSVLLLNPDACVLPGCLATLADELGARPDCAVAGPAVRDDHGDTDRNARGDPDMLTGFFGRSTWLTKRFPNSRLARRNVIADAPPGGEPGLDVDWMTGSCILVRRKAFDAVGGFDERYFMYWEDADLCRRMRANGWRIRYRPDAKAIHSGGVSSRTSRKTAIRAFHDSAYLYYRTHVAASPLNPVRWLAYGLLRLRCWWLGG